MKHKHQTKGRSVFRAFAGPLVTALRPNPAAHGNITRVDTCRCGAQRHVNVNGAQRELGKWMGGSL